MFWKVQNKSKWQEMIAEKPRRLLTKISFSTNQQFMIILIKGLYNYFVKNLSSKQRAHVKSSSENSQLGILT